jgi:branched-chain amino acid aminotransferase
MKKSDEANMWMKSAMRSVRRAGLLWRGASQAAEVPVEVQQVERRKPKPPLEGLGFGTVFTDHMLTMAWSRAGGWEAPRIVPHGPLSLEPGATVLQYAQTVFEGMKAVRGGDGKVRLFRPRHNARRLNVGAARACLPEVPEEVFLSGLKTLLQLEQDWAPGQPNTALYIRPTLIGTEACFGVRPADSALFYIILSPVGPYFKGDKAINLDCNTDYVRTWPGGCGHTKMGANYVGTMLAGRRAMARGCETNGWLWGPEDLLTESGATNLFCVVRGAGGPRLLTPPIDGLVLPGVVRESVLQLARWRSLHCTARTAPGTPCTG